MEVKPLTPVVSLTSQPGHLSLIGDHGVNLKAQALSATQAAYLMRNGRMTVVDYVSSLLAYIQARDVLIKAWVFLDEEAVMKEALRLDALAPHERGPLHGVAVGIKDIIQVKDMPTRYGSRLHEHDGVAPDDAAVVSILRSSGAIILGKTATTEFAATSQGGPCANPLDLRRTPGGSSSGSAAAVADFHCPISLGTQTGGSMIRPASFTGIFGMKPTWGVLSTEGVGRFSITCDTIGFYARTMGDLSLLSTLFDLQNESLPRTLSPDPGLRRVAMIQSPVWLRAGPGTRKAWFQAQEQLIQSGVCVSHIKLPEAFGKCLRWRDTIVSNEAKIALRPRYVRNKRLLGDSIRQILEKDDPCTQEELLHAYDSISLLRAQWDQIAKDYDFVLTPSVPDEAPLGLDCTGSSIFCAMWTILHVPVLNVPVSVGKYGMPIGLTVTGRRYDDSNIIEAGSWLRDILIER